MKLRLTFLVLSILLVAVVIPGQGVDEKLRAELIAMRDRDQQARDGCDKDTPDERMKCFANLLDKVDKPNTKRINEIYNEIGFPDASKVGKDGLEAFLLILQHSNDLELKQKCLSAITKSFEAKLISASEYANFTDRLLFNLGKPQVYGCNFEFKEGKLVMSKTEDLKNLDERRKKIGLMPIAEYAKILKDVYKMDVVIPDLQ